MVYKLNQAKILVIDDMIPMLKLTQSILGVFGFKQVRTAQSGREGFDITCRFDPDLIITDWMMDPMDGLEFTRKVRTSPLSPNPYVPILMMTGFSSRFRVESARDSGITEFLVKPFTSKDLYSRVQQIIEKPRQFVDAGTFFGPDRRRRIISDYEGPKRRNDDESEPTQEQKEASDILKKLSQEARNVS